MDAHWRLSGRPPRYGAMPLSEDAPSVAEDPYSLSKLQSEEILAACHRAYGLTTAALRFAGVWDDAMRRAHRERAEPTTAWSDDLWQWVHVADVVAGIRAAVECATLPPCGVYDLGAPDTRSPSRRCGCCAASVPSSRRRCASRCRDARRCCRSPPRAARSATRRRGCFAEAAAG